MPEKSPFVRCAPPKSGEPIQVSIEPDRLPYEALLALNRVLAERKLPFNGAVTSISIQLTVMDDDEILGPSDLFPKIVLRHRG